MPDDPQHLEARIRELEGAVRVARSSANHQRKQKQAANISRNRAVQGVEHWKAKAEELQAQVEGCREALEKIEGCSFASRDGYWQGGVSPIVIARQALALLKEPGNGK